MEFSSPDNVCSYSFSHSVRKLELILQVYMYILYRAHPAIVAMCYKKSKVATNIIDKPLVVYRFLGNVMK